MTRALLAIALVAACGPKGGGGDGANEPDPDLATTRPAARADLPRVMLKRLAVAAKCGEAGSQHRLWCAAAEGWETGTAAELPDGPHVYLGLSLGMLEEGDDQDSLSGNVFLTAFAVNRKGDTIKAVITDVRSNGGEEQKMVDVATATVTQVLSGHAKLAQVPKPLHEWLMGVPPDAPHPLTREATGWRLKGPTGAEIRRVGEVWVALESPIEGPPGLFVSIFTDKIEPAP